MKLIAIVLGCLLTLGEQANAQTQVQATAAVPAHAKRAAKPAAPAKGVAKKSANVPGAKKSTVAAKAKSIVPVAAVGAAGIAAADAGKEQNLHLLDIKSTAALVLDVEDGQLLFAKNVDHVRAIASITKLMTAIVVLDEQQPLDEVIRIDTGDIDRVKGTGSRLRIGAELTRKDLLHLALMSSENRAANALGRNFPGGLPAFVERMNDKALQLGMTRSRFVDPTGLSSENVSTADDLARLVRASVNYPLIREFSTSPNAQVTLADNGRTMGFGNSNGLVASSEWHIDLSKTGYISEAGRCLVMYARIMARPVIIVLLDSWGLYTRIGDANRIKRWMERGGPSASNPFLSLPTSGLPG